jgi:hypothetical protein
MFSTAYVKGPIVTDATLAIATVARILSSSEWQLTGGPMSRHGTLTVGPVDVLGVQGNGSNLLVGYSHPDGIAARLIDSKLGLICRRSDGGLALIIGYPCQFSHPSGDESKIRVDTVNSSTTVVMFDKKERTLF